MGVKIEKMSWGSMVGTLRKMEVGETKDAPKGCRRNSLNSACSRLKKTEGMAFTVKEVKPGLVRVTRQM